MSTYTRIGPYILTEVVQELPYGSLHRAVKTQGLAYLDHLHVLVFNDEAIQAGVPESIERHRDWFEAFEGLKRVDAVGTLEASGQLALVLPHFRGRSLASMMTRNAEDRMVRLEHILSFALDLATIIASINSAGLVHGALSLDTTWVDIDGHIRVLDAPLGKVLLKTGLQVKAMGPLAPHKRILGDGFGNDQESFGLILFHLISGSWPNRSGLDASVDGLSMAQEDWGVQQVVPIPGVVKDLVRRAIQGAYTDAQTFLAAVKAAYNHPDCEPFNATTFGVAFLLASMIRLDLPGEAEALEIEKSDEFLEAVGEPKVIERERIIYQEDLRKKRRNIAIAVVLAVAGLAGGGYALVRASKHRAQQEGIRKETENLIARYNREARAFQDEERLMLERIANAQTAGEKQALVAEFEKARKAHEMELAAIRASIERLQRQQQGIGGTPKQVEIPPVPGVPKAGGEPSIAPANVAPSPVSSQAKSVPAEPVAPAVVANQRERVRIAAESVPFTPSTKVPIGQEGNPQLATGEPVYLTGATKVEMLQPPAARSVPSPSEAPTVAARDQHTVDRVRKLVIPQMDQGTLRAFEGQIVRIRVLVDQFGYAKAAAVDQCPPALASEFKMAAMKTQFNPLIENGRAKQGWVGLAFRVTGTGIALDGAN